VAKLRKANLELSKAQIEFLYSEDQYTLFAGGLGSGKTYAGAVWAVLMAIENPDTVGIITANSYSQLKKATLAKFFEICDSLGLRYVYKQQDGVILLGKSTIYTISMEKYDLLRGIEAGWAWSDECAFYKEEAFNVLIGRIRDPRGTCQWKGTTTPNGLNWVYEMFVENPKPGTHVVRARTKENVANLGANYLKTLMSQYDSKLAQQELDGQFVNLNSGSVYHAFDRFKHTRKFEENFNVPLFVGLDFNVNPLCGVYVYIVKGVIYVVDELYLEHSNTAEASKEILKRFPFREIKVVADQSGATRSTKASVTDHEILRRRGLDVLKFSNPEIRDRYNNINRLLEHGKLVISPRCKKLIADLEKLTFDNKDPMLSHISDALGYACWHLDPLKKPKRKASVSYR